MRLHVPLIAIDSANCVVSVVFRQPSGMPHRLNDNDDDDDNSDSDDDDGDDDNRSDDVASR